MIKFETCVKYNDKYLFFSRNYNACVSCDDCFSNWEVVASLPKEDFFAFQLCRKMFVWNDCVIFVPYEAKNVYIFSVIDRKWDMIELRANKDGNESKRFIGANLIGDVLWLFGSYYRAIVRIDLTTLNIEYLTDSVIENYFGTDMLFRGDGCVVGHKILNPMSVNNMLYFVDIDNLTIEKKEIGANNKYSGICIDGDGFWLSPRNDETIVYINDRSEIEKEIKLPANNEWGEMTFSGVYKVGSHVLFPSFRDCYKSVEIDRNTDCIEVKAEAYLFVSCLSKDVTIAQRLDGIIVLWEKDSKQEYEGNLKKDDLIDFAMKNKELLVESKKHISEGIIYENEDFSLDEYMKIICS